MKSEGRRVKWDGVVNSDQSSVISKNRNSVIANETIAVANPPEGQATKDKRVKELCVAIERKLRGELRRFQFSHHLQNLASVLVEESFGRGHVSVVIPHQTDLSLLTGIRPNQVSPALQRLINMRVLTVTKGGMGDVYRISTSTNQWQVTPKFMPIEARRALDTIRRVNPNNGTASEETLRQMAHELAELTGDGEDNSDGPKGAAAPYMMTETGSVLVSRMDENGNLEEIC